MKLSEFTSKDIYVIDYAFFMNYWELDYWLEGITPKFCLLKGMHCLELY